MRIVTTFDDRLYAASGKTLLETVRRHLPSAEILVYEELTSEQVDGPSVRVDRLPEFEQVLRDHRDIIPTDMGGTAVKLKGYNRRWFGWFRKVIAQYDALTRRPYEGYTVFLDSDVRVTAPFGDAEIRAELQAAVGVFKGLRESIESGVIFYDGTSPLAPAFAERFLHLFLSGEFRDFPRWDDSYVMAQCMSQMPEAVQDLAAGIASIEHTNSNGHTASGQVIPATGWNRYLEHDKGVHWRKGVVPAMYTPNKKRRTFLDKLFGRIRRKAA